MRFSLPSARPWRSRSRPSRRSNKWATRCARSSRRAERVLAVRPRRSTQRFAEARLGLLMAAPALLTIVVIAVIPLAQTIGDSLFQISLKFENAPRPFVGLDNYLTVLQDDDWLNALRVTSVVTVASVAVELVLG